jgi:fused signal recognition particle receptor
VSITVIVIAVAIVALLALAFAMRKPALPSADDPGLDAASDTTESRRRDGEARPRPGAAQLDTGGEERLDGDAPHSAAPHSDDPRSADPRSADRRSDDGGRDMAITVMPEESSIGTGGPPSRTPTKRAKDVASLRKGLAKVRQSGGLFGRLKALLAGSKEISPSLVEEIEEILLTSDVGVKTTEMLLSELRDGLAKNERSDPDKVWAALRKRTAELLDVPGGGSLREHGRPTVVLMVGVNGTGKTTTIGKLATKLVARDKTVLLVAGDTFRAAAVAQLQAWGTRVGCEVFAGADNADPASVVFDAVKHGVEQRADVILVDTAGRLHTKSNLMDELKKIVRTAGKALDGAPHETLLVVDGTTGQNAVQQAQMFGEALDLDGIVLTKLDGTAKGGVVLAIAAEHQLPVRYVGVGERADDLRDFNATEFAEAMLGQGDDAAEAA